MVIVPSVFGVTDDVFHYSKQFSEQGALVYTLDPLWRDGKGALRIPEDGAQAIERMNQISDESVLNDLLETCDAGLQDDMCSGKLVLLGICFGGRFVLKATKHIHAHGIAIWHGANVLPELDERHLEQTDIAMDFGGQDPLIPLRDVEAIKVKLEPFNATIRVHEGCGHGFTHWGTQRCEPRAAKKAAQAVP